TVWPCFSFPVSGSPRAPAVTPVSLPLVTLTITVLPGGTRRWPFDGLIEKCTAGVAGGAETPPAWDGAPADMPLLHAPATATMPAMTTAWTGARILLVMLAPRHRVPAVSTGTKPAGAPIHNRSRPRPALIALRQPREQQRRLRQQAAHTARRAAAH